MGTACIAAPAIVPAVDVMLPYLDLENKILKLARGIPDDQFPKFAKIFCTS